MVPRSIVLTPHAHESMERRGATEAEVRATIEDAPWAEAKHGRYEAASDYSFHAQWNKKLYTTKRVNPIFIIEEEKIIVITVYTFYF